MKKFVARWPQVVVRDRHRSMWRLSGWWSAVWRGRAWAWAPSAIGDYGGAGTPTSAAASTVGGGGAPRDVAICSRSLAPSWRFELFR